MSLRSKKKVLAKMQYYEAVEAAKEQLQQATASYLPKPTSNSSFLTDLRAAEAERDISHASEQKVRAAESEYERAKDAYGKANLKFGHRQHELKVAKAALRRLKDMNMYDSPKGIKAQSAVAKSEAAVHTASERLPPLRKAVYLAYCTLVELLGDDAPDMPENMVPEDVAGKKRSAPSGHTGKS